jgi:hypothetical protein
MALDFGDANVDQDPIFAPRNANISKRSVIGSANLEFDFWFEGIKWRMVFAHDALPHLVGPTGQFISRGTVIDKVNSTGANASHLHFQYGYFANYWHWVDPWPYFEQNRNLQFNAGVTGVRIRIGPGLGFDVWGQALSTGIVRNDGIVIAPFATILMRYPTVSVNRDGYEWMPFTLVGESKVLWTAKSFIHFL